MAKVVNLAQVRGARLSASAGQKGRCIEEELRILEQLRALVARLQEREAERVRSKEELGTARLEEAVVVDLRARAALTGRV